ncbi:MAG TPA: hypothetical protein VF590_23820 [Isosphaeraceae bacterium]|jgi:hypothetical protein
MQGLRISIAGLMALILACGLGLAALKSVSPLWSSVTFTVALSALLVATLGAALRGRHRTFWLGFAVFGWGYALFSFAPGAETQIRPYLLTTRMLDALVPVLGVAPSARVYHMNPKTGGVSGWTGFSNQGHYERTGHSLAILLHGLAGAVLAVLWAAYEGRTDGRLG